MGRSAVGTGSLVTSITARPWADASPTALVDGGRAPFRRLAADRRARASVALRPAGQGWVGVGTEEARGIVPETLTMSADEHGPLDANFKLARDPSSPWSELRAFTPCKVEVGGVNVWQGRVQETPGERGEQRSLSVSGRGGQQYLDDDRVDITFALCDLTAWRSTRALAACPLGNFIAGAEPSVGDGVAIIGFPNGTAHADTNASGITLDLGASNVAKRVVLDATAINPHNFCTVYIRAHSTENPLALSISDAAAVKHDVIGAVTAGTFTTGYRYVSIFMYRDDHTAPSVTSADHLLKITRVQVYTDTAYESGNESALRSSQVFRVMRPLVPQLATDDSGITDSPLIDALTPAGIPHLTSAGRAPVRALAEAAAAYHDYLWGVDADLRLYFTPRPSTPVVEVGEWSGASWSGSSLSTAEDIYNGVVVTGQDGAGGTLEVFRTASSPLLDALGVNRTQQLTVDAILTVESATAIADIWLNEASRTQLAGDITIAGFGSVRRRATGDPLHPAHLLRMTGQRILLNMADPDTGAWGRVATMTAVSYTHDGETATITLDNRRAYFESLLARIGAIQAAR